MEGASYVDYWQEETTVIWDINFLASSGALLCYAFQGWVGGAEHSNSYGMGFTQTMLTAEILTLAIDFYRDYYL